MFRLSKMKEHAEVGTLQLQMVPKFSLDHIKMQHHWKYYEFRVSIVLPIPRVMGILAWPQAN